MLLVLTGTGWEAYAQTLPDPSWAEFEVRDGDVKSYTVTGDASFSQASKFVWVVSGGTLYTDENAFTIAGDGTSYSAQGNSSNQSTLYVKWEGTGNGYVYAYELSAYGCQQPDDLQEKYVGVRVSKIPMVATLAFTEADDPDNLLTVCSYNGGGQTKNLSVRYTGSKPWDLYYKRVKSDGTEEELTQTGITGEEVQLSIAIDEFFVNTEAGDRDWKIILIKAVSTGDNHETTPDAVRERTIVVHPLPVINGGIIMN